MSFAVKFTAVARQDPLKIYRFNWKNKFPGVKFKGEK
jgi:hypothetical protein